MRVVRVLDEAVQENCHLVELVHVICHNVDELLYPILKEEQFSLLRILVKELVGNKRKGLNHQSHQVVRDVSLLTVTTAFRGDRGVHISEAAGKEVDEVGEVQHATGQELNDLSGVVLDLDEDVNDNLIGDVVEALVEILYAALVVLLEDLELGISLVQLQRDHTSDNIR